VPQKFGFARPSGPQRLGRGSQTGKLVLDRSSGLGQERVWRGRGGGGASARLQYCQIRISSWETDVDGYKCIGQPPVASTINIFL
jgi:hypothetical protein